MTKSFDDVVDQRLEVRRHDMAVALRWAIALFAAFILVTLDVIYEGALWRVDQFFADLDRPRTARTGCMTTILPRSCPR